MNTDTIQLEKITSACIKELQLLSRQTFVEAFGWYNTAENMQHYLDTYFTEEKLLQEINDALIDFYFIRQNGLATGYLKINFGEAQTDLKDNKALEIERIYVLKDFQGKKLGEILLAKAMEIAADRGLNYIWLGVWEKNHRAIRFYEKNGFVSFGTHIFMLGDDEQTDIMMRLDLADKVL